MRKSQILAVISSKSCKHTARIERNSYVFMFPQQSLDWGVLADVLRGWVECKRALPGVSRCQLLCAGCGNGEGHVAPVYAKRSLTQLLTVKHNGFGTFWLQMPPGALGASCGSLGALGVPCGCLLGASWVLLGWLLAAWCPWVDIQVDRSRFFRLTFRPRFSNSSSYLRIQLEKKDGGL